MTIADKLTLLASSKEQLRISLGLPKNLPFSEYYKHAYPYDLLTLFAGGKQGAWYDPSDLSTLFQNAAGTIPVTADGDPIGCMKDKSGNGYHATQTVSAARPIYRTDGVLHWFETDGVNDFFNTNLIPTTNWSSALALSVARTGGFIFDSNYNSANNYVSSSRANLIVFGSPTGQSNNKEFVFGEVFTHISEVTDDNVGNAITIGGRLDSSNVIGFTSQSSIYAMLFINGTITASERAAINKYLAKKAGLEL